MLTLENFEEQIGAVILQRGVQYYKQGAVNYLEETGKNVWEAEVDGSETYCVEIKIKRGTEISKCDCDCPYDDSICKHVVAVLFAIKNEISKSGSVKKNPATKVVFEKLLQKITVKEFQDFIRQHVAKDKNFKTEFELYFSAKDESIDDVEKKYAELIRKIINKHSDRGFIDYRAASKLAGDIGKLYITGTEFIKHNNFSDAFALAKSLLKGMMNVIGACDDSSGSIAGLIDEVVNLFDMIADADKAARPLKEQIFFFLQTELHNKNYFDYGDFSYSLFAVFAHLAIQLNNAEAFLSFIDAQLPKLTGKYDDYRKDFFKTEKIAFLKATGKTTEAEKLIAQNLDITGIRQLEVNNAINKKDYRLAKQLINDGIKIAQNKSHPGTVDDWKKELLRIAVLEEDINTVRDYTKYFAFDRWFNKEYYYQWKNTYQPHEWEPVIEAVIEEKTNLTDSQNKKNKNIFWYQPGSLLLAELAPIYIEEQYWQRLLALVQEEKNLDTVLRYHEYLVKIYPMELLAIYLPMLQSAGDNANNRSDYSKLVMKMEKIMKDIPVSKEKIMAVAQSLKTKHIRRPAMVDELNKILK